MTAALLQTPDAPYPFVRVLGAIGMGVAFGVAYGSGLLWAITSLLPPPRALPEPYRTLFPYSFLLAAITVFIGAGAISALGLGTRWGAPAAILFILLMAIVMLGPNFITPTVVRPWSVLAVQTVAMLTVAGALGIGGGAATFGIRRRRSVRRGARQP
jgi:hypothetical protein